MTESKAKSLGVEEAPDADDDDADDGTGATRDDDLNVGSLTTI